MATALLMFKTVYKGRLPELSEVVAVCECSLKYLMRFSGSLVHATPTEANLCIYLDVETPLFVGSQFKIV